MNNDFEKVKSALDLHVVITQETGFKIKGKHLEECPFCKGHECFSVQDDHYKCFQCDASGDVFEFLSTLHGMDKAGSLKKAAEIAGVALEEKGKKKTALTTFDSIRLEAARYYHGHMLENGGKEYLVEKRGHNIEALKKMQVGWSDGMLLDNLRGKGFSDQDIVASGLAKVKEVEGEKKVLDFFGRHLVIFPHISKDKVLHFTLKDPEKKVAYQLPNEARSKQWCFYNQDAIDKYNEIILVEGENDLLSILDAGAGNVIAMIGQISDDQIKALGNRCKGKHLYLWVDNDQAGEKYIRKVCKALVDINTRVVVYDESVKDPDEYIQRFKGDRKAEIKRLQRDAVDYITWEISRTAVLPNLEDKLKHLQKEDVFKSISLKAEIEQQIYSEKLEGLGFSKKAIEQQLDFSQELYQQIAVYYETLNSPKNADPVTIANIIYKYFANNGRVYFDRKNTVYLMYQNRTYEIGNNVAFNALLHKLTRLIYNMAPGASIWEALRCIAYNSGRRIDRAQWIYTDARTDTIYLNLNGANNTILKVNREGICEVPNGMNEDHILLNSSHKMTPFNYLPDTDISEGMTALQELVFNNLTCEKKQRYFILCWFISGFLQDFVPYQALMKFAGTSGSGKSTAAKLLTTLMYGNEQLGELTGAAAYSLAAQNPLLVIDNLESKDITRTIQKFLLLAATRGQKEKRTSGTETETTEESPRALICVTAIEPFTLPELINRTYDLSFDYKKYGDESFYETQVLSNIKKKRDLILSALLKFIQKEILPDVGKCQDYITVLRKEYKGHAKERTNEYLAMLMVILDKALNYIPYYTDEDLLNGIETGAADIREGWIEEQNTRAKDTESGSNNILKLLDGLLREYLHKFKDSSIEAQYKAEYEGEVFVLNHPEYGLEIIKTKPKTHEDEDGSRYSTAHIEFMASSADLVHTFDRFCRNNGLKNPYESAAVFGARLKNDMVLMKKGGWELVTKEGMEPYFKTIHGKRFLKFRHTLVRG